MDMHMIFKRLLVVLVASGGISLMPAMAEEDSDICAPFRDGKVDESLVAGMLEAAESGYLYRIKKDTSRVGFCVSTEFSEVKGEFRDFSGGLALVPEHEQADLEQRAMVVIRAASLDTRGSMVESIIKSERFFDVERYPEILFVSRGFEWTGRDSARITGDLTVHGVTRQVVFDVVLTPIDQPGNSTVERLLVKASTTIRRSDFDMDSMSRLVSDTVDLCMSVEAVRYAG